MSREWKPGDVARTVNNGTIARTARHRWILLDDGHPIDLADEKIARPLVVIDPEDAEQVERFTDTWVHARSGHDFGNAYPGEIEHMQTALREFANPTPPKPEEPTGLGAVVEDANGVQWVRTENRANIKGTVWQSSFHVDLADKAENREYVDINAVRVLSEGIQS